MEKTMPFDSEGNFTRVHNWDEDRQNNIDIASDRMDEEFDNYADGLNDCLLRDGRSTMTGDLRMGNFQIKNVAKGTVNSDVVNKEQLDKVSTDLDELFRSLINQIWVIGDIKASVKEDNHGSWFLCDGQAISRVTYSKLFEIIGTNFGEGDGVTTFNLPDYRGKFLRGLGKNSAENIYTLQKEGLPNIKGFMSNWAANIDNGKEDSALYGTSADGQRRDSGYTANGCSGINLDASRSNSIYGASEHVTPENYAVNYFIKVAEEE
jgi:hypothetical protein